MHWKYDEKKKKIKEAATNIRNNADRKQMTQPDVRGLLRWNICCWMIGFGFAESQLPTDDNWLRPIIGLLFAFLIFFYVFFWNKIFENAMPNFFLNIDPSQGHGNGTSVKFLQAEYLQRINTVE